MRHKASGERKDKSGRRYFDKISLKKKRNWESERKFLSLINWTKMGKFSGGSGEKREKKGRRKERRKRKREKEKKKRKGKRIKKRK